MDVGRDIDGAIEAGQHVKSERPFIAKVLCIALVAAIMLPFGGLLFPYVSTALTPTQFEALEAVVSATVGFGIYGLLG